MSYDLYLASPTLTRETFARYFCGRRNYNDAAFYANEDTGVYFSFEFYAADESDDPDTPDFLRAPHVAFNLNFVRPHAFALEAEPEVAALVAAFGCAVHDPQIDGAAPIHVSHFSRVGTTATPSAIAPSRANRVSATRSSRTMI